MGIAVGILALICALVLLFGRHGTRKILGWSLGLTVLGAVCAVAAVWTIEHNRQASSPIRLSPGGLFDDIPITAPPFDPSKPYWELDPVTNQYHWNPGTNARR